MNPTLMDKAMLTIMEKALSWLVSGKAFAVIKELVSTLMGEDMPGAEKKEKVWNEVLPIVKENGTKFGLFILSTAITFIVDSIRIQAAIKAQQIGSNGGS